MPTTRTGLPAPGSPAPAPPPPAHTRSGASHDSPELTVDDLGVTARRRPGLVEFVAWGDVAEVAIRAVDERGATAHYWLLGDRSGTGVVVPHLGPAADALLSRLRSLPGFDVHAAGAGLDATGDRLTIVWREGRAP